MAQDDPEVRRDRVTMDLYLVRHAEAEPRSAGVEDGARALTASGAERFLVGVSGLARLGVRFDRIHHSPLLRAVETAELLLPLLDGDGRTIVTPGLAHSPERGLLANLQGERVALVGHEPSLSELLATLVLGWQVLGSDEQAPFTLEKGGVAWLDGELRPGAMTLRALWPPKTLRRLGR